MNAPLELQQLYFADGKNHNNNGLVITPQRTAYPRDAFRVRLNLTQQLHRMPEFGHGMGGTLQCRRAGGRRRHRLHGAIDRSYNARLLVDDMRHDIPLRLELVQAPEHLRVGRKSV